MVHRARFARTLAVLSAFALTFGIATAAGVAPYKINVILPLTGPLAFIGQTDERSLQVFQDVTNRQGGIRGRPIQLVFSDDQGNPQLSVQIASRILAEKPAVVLGTASAGNCSAIEPLFERSKTLAWCFSPTFYPPMGGFVYPTAPGSKDLMRAQVRYMRERGIKRLAMLATTDVSGKLGESDLKDVLKEPGNEAVTLTADEVFGSSDVSVVAQLAKIKATNPDAIMVWTSGPALGTALTGLRDTGLDGMPVFAASSGMIWSQITGLTSVIPKTLYFTGHPIDRGRNAQATDKLKEYIAAMNAAGIHIDGVTGIVWDPASIVIDALRAAGPNASAEQLRSWIAGQKAYPGIYGIYDYKADMHGLSSNDVLVVRWDPQKQAWVAASKFGGSPL